MQRKRAPKAQERTDKRRLDHARCAALARLLARIAAADDLHKQLSPGDREAYSLDTPASNLPEDLP
jgi:hypothetical protein